MAINNFIKCSLSIYHMKVHSLSFKVVQYIFHNNEKWRSYKKLNEPFLGSHTSNEGKISSGYICPLGLPTKRISSKSERVMCETSVGGNHVQIYLNLRNRQASSRDITTNFATQPCHTLSGSFRVIPYQFTEVSHMTLSDLDEICFVGSPSGHM